MSAQAEKMYRGDTSVRRSAAAPEIAERSPLKRNVPPSGVRIRPIALPVEHGGWGISLEPIALGLLLAPSVAGVGLAIATMGAFLARHPFKLVACDRRRGRRYPRTAVAERFALLYASIAALGLTVAIQTAQHGFLLPLLLAAPLALIQIVYDGLGRSRALAPELAGSMAMAAVASGIALAGGWRLPAALGLWAVLSARVVPAILYVRARLQLLKGQAAAPLPAILAHVAGLLLIIALARMNIVPILAVAALLVLLGRATLGLLWRGKPVTAKQVGFQEIGFGAMTVLAVAIGQSMGW